MMRGVQVKLLHIPGPAKGQCCALALKVGDIGYVTGANYELRLVQVRFAYGELWLRASDVTHAYPIVCAVPVSITVTVQVGTMKRHDEYAKGPAPWIHSMDGTPRASHWTPGWYAK